MFAMPTATLPAHWPTPAGISDDTSAGNVLAASRLSLDSRSTDRRIYRYR